MDQPGQGSSAGNESRAVLDFDALRKRAAQRRAARATAGMKKPFDWEAE